MSVVPHSKFLRFLPLLLSLFLPASVFAQCAPPSNPGVRICTPTPNATLVLIPTVAAPTIQFNSTPVFGTEIVKFIVYDNNQRILFHTDGLTGTQVEPLPIN